jgi:membrane-associated phospholipid phosphatase
MVHRARSSLPFIRDAMNRLARCSLLAALLLPLPIFAAGQNAPNPSQDISRPAQMSAAPGPGTGHRLSYKTLPASIVSDQKPIWTFPVRAAVGHHWKPAVGVTLATAGLVFLDSRDAPYFRRTQSFHGLNNAASGRNTSIGMAAVPLATLMAGWLHHDSYAQQTALEAGEAVADSQLVALGMKMASRRLRPGDISPNGDFGRTWYKSNTNLGYDSSFPSGHTIAAFSIATVFAERYRRHRWVPWVAYGAATFVGFSRITLQAHFPADVFAGAALGYSISHFVVLRRRSE